MKTPPDTTVRAFVFLFKNTRGRNSLSSQVKGPGLTAEKALEFTTEYVRQNLIQIYEVPPSP